MHQMHISLIAGVSTQIAMSISQARQVNYFPGLLSFFFFLLLLFFLSFVFNLPLWKGPCGMDVMRWSAQKGNLSSVCTITFI